MKFSQLLTAPNQLTLLRMMFLPFIVINMLNGHYRWALVLFVLAGLSDGLDGLLARMLQAANHARAVSRSHRRQASA